MIAVPRRLVLPLAVFVLGLVAMGAAVMLTLPGGHREAAAGGVGGPFALTAGDGRIVTERDVRGAPHLVFFGFTHCPDVCPTTLAQVSDVLDALGDKGRGANPVRAYFVSVDPERDTPEVMRTYLGSFDSRIVGLSGDPARVAAMARAYRVYAKKVPLKDGDYTMEHTSLVYLMDAEDRFVGAFNLARPPAQAAADLAKML